MSGQRLWLGLVGLLGAGAVLLGATASHWLTIAEPARFAVASQYHFIHVLAMLAVSLGLEPGLKKHLVLLLFAVGMVLFCGTLYGASAGIWGTRLAPVGGISLILGWLVLAVPFALRGKQG